MASGGWFFLIIIVLVLIGVTAWVIITRRRAAAQGLPPPPISSYNPFGNRSRSSQSYGGQSRIVGWAKSKFSSLKGSGAGAYERPANAGQRRGLDPDGAWDARVGDEADGYGAGGYYEEQELGLQPPSSASHLGGGYGPSSPSPQLPEYGADEPERGRRRSRDDAFIGGSQRGLDQRYDEEMGKQNPFGEGAERSSLRGVSSRPAELDAQGHSQKDGAGGHGDSPTERRSMFHENV